MNKQTGIIVGVGVLMLVVAIVAFRFVGGAKPKAEEIVPTPTIAYKEVDASVQVSLSPNANKTKATLSIAGFGSRFVKIEYEVLYDTDNNGTQGTSGMADITSQDEFEREVEFGSCSTGGKCTYDKGVRNIKVTAKLHTPDGEIFLLRKEFPTL